MATVTRFYLTDTPFTDISIASTNLWNDTSSALIRKCSVTPTGTTMASYNISATNVTDTLVARFVTPTLDSFFFNGTVRGQIRMGLNNASNCTLISKVAVSIIQSDGTIRQNMTGTGVDGDTSLSTTLQNRKTPLYTTMLGSGSTMQGDRVLIEIGVNRTSGSASRTLTTSWGDDNGSDLPEDNTTTTGLNPWIEFSASFVFYTPSPVTGNPMYMVMD